MQKLKTLPDLLSAFSSNYTEYFEIHEIKFKLEKEIKQITLRSTIKTTHKKIYSTTNILSSRTFKNQMSWKNFSSPR